MDVILRRASLAAGAAGTNPIGGGALPLVPGVSRAVTVEELVTSSAAKTGSEGRDENLVASLAATLFALAAFTGGSGVFVRFLAAPIIRNPSAAFSCGCW